MTARGPVQRAVELTVRYRGCPCRLLHGPLDVEFCRKLRGGSVRRGTATRAAGMLMPCCWHPAQK